jgi:hypothetical protein
MVSIGLVLLLARLPRSRRRSDSFRSLGDFCVSGSRRERARQAENDSLLKNTEAERRACEIRLRAEKEYGRLSAQLETAPDARIDLTSSSPEKRLTKAEALADQFDAALAKRTGGGSAAFRLGTTPLWGEGHPPPVRIFATCGRVNSSSGKNTANGPRGIEARAKVRLARPTGPVRWRISTLARGKAVRNGVVSR